MRHCFFAASLLCTATAGAEMPELLDAAVHKYAAEAGHWAYTMTNGTRDRAGKVEDTTVTRVDPSQPYDAQLTLRTKNGRPATEREVKKIREQAEKARQNRKTLGELLELDQAFVAEETPEAITYEVPLNPRENDRLPPETFRITIRVNQAQQVFEHVAVRLRAPLRAAIIVKLTAGEADIDFASVDPGHPPPVASIRADGAGTVLFLKVGGSYEQTRSDFKRVTPYSGRFKVKLGPLKFLDF